MTGAGRRGAVPTPVAHRRSGFTIVALFAVFHSVEIGSWVSVTSAAHLLDGTNGAAVAMVAQLSPAVLVALMTGDLLGRVNPRSVLMVSLVTQAIGLAGVGYAVDHGAGLAVLTVMAAVTSAAMAATRPALITILPSVAPGPTALARLTARLGWIQAAALTVGSLITALLIREQGLGSTFGWFAVVIVACVAVAATLPRPPDVPAESHRPLRSALSSVLRDAGPRTVLLLIGLHSFVVGAIDLLVVVLALDVFDGVPSDAALLVSAWGVGAIAGSTIAIVTTRLRSTPAIAVAMAGSAAALVALALVPNRTAAASALVVCSACTSILLLSGRALLIKVTRVAVLAHAFALAEAAELSLLLVGTAAVPVAVALTDARHASIVLGIVVVLAGVSLIAGLARAEASAVIPAEQLAILSGVPLLDGLPPGALELLAVEAVPVTVPADTAAVTEGDFGDRFYVIVSGTFDVTKEGRLLRSLVPGDGFGDLALLWNVPRAATVTARVNSRCLSIDRQAFLIAVQSHAATFDVLINRSIAFGVNPSGPSRGGRPRRSRRSG